MASKNERELKVCALSGHNYKPVPSIRLMGQWLEAAGFHIGDPVLVRCEDGRLIISLDTERAELIEAEKTFMFPPRLCLLISSGLRCFTKLPIF